MSVSYLKIGTPEAHRAEGDIGTRGDVAARDLSPGFDSRCPVSFRLCQDKIDVWIAQKQVRNFAQSRRETMPDLKLAIMSATVPGRSADRDGGTFSATRSLPALAPLNYRSIK